ncbi:hypothetical protein BN1708_013431, partial [Verticillium longisporum]
RERLALPFLHDWDMNIHQTVGGNEVRNLHPQQRCDQPYQPSSIHRVNPSPLPKMKKVRHSYYLSITFRFPDSTPCNPVNRPICVRTTHHHVVASCLGSAIYLGLDRYGETPGHGYPLSPLNEMPHTMTSCDAANLSVEVLQLVLRTLRSLCPIIPGPPLRKSQSLSRENPPTRKPRGPTVSHHMLE